MRQHISFRSRARFFRYRPSKCNWWTLLAGLGIQTLPSLLPPDDPPADCRRTNTSLPCDSSGGFPSNPHGHKIVAVSQTGWLGGISLCHPHDASSGLRLSWEADGDRLCCVTMERLTLFITQK